MASFNIQVFGVSKVNKPFIQQTLLTILDRYDLIFIQEIRDNDNSAIFTLLSSLRAKTKRDFQLKLSERLGRGEMKEQYAYIYDAKRVSALEAYTFDDSEGDVFEREPFVAHFEVEGLKFTIGGIHITPTNVKGELAAMNEVYRDIKKRYSDGNIFLLGDLNADCLYYKPIWGFDYFDHKATMLTSDDEDTTVGATNCAYDRVLGFGSIVNRTSTATAFNFQNEYGMDLASAKLISDHYPVEFTIRLDGSKIKHPGDDGEEMPIDDGEELPPVAIDPVCGAENYLSPKGYCMGNFGKVRQRVSALCCPIDN